MVEHGLPCQDRSALAQFSGPLVWIALCSVRQNGDVSALSRSGDFRSSTVAGHSDEDEMVEVLRRLSSTSVRRCKRTGMACIALHGLHFIGFISDALDLFQVGSAVSAVDF